MGEGVIEIAYFKKKGKDLYIDNKKVIRGWQSYNGMYWFATIDAARQTTTLPGGKKVPNDTIYYGYVQAKDEEWTYFSKAHLENLKPTGKLWEIPKRSLPYSGRRKR